MPQSVNPLFAMLIATCYLNIVTLVKNALSFAKNTLDAIVTLCTISRRTNLIVLFAQEKLSSNEQSDVALTFL